MADVSICISISISISYTLKRYHPVTGRVRTTLASFRALVS